MNTGFSPEVFLSALNLNLISAIFFSSGVLRVSQHFSAEGSLEFGPIEW